MNKEGKTKNHQERFSVINESLHQSILLGLRLFGDILDGEALLADDGSHELSRHEHAQGEVVLPGAQSAEAS